MPHKHFIIPDTLTTKSIKIGLQSKDRLKWKILTPWTLSIVHGKRAWAFLFNKYDQQNKNDYYR